MPNQKVPQLPILTAITDADLFYVVDVSDTTDDPTGSSKQVTREEILTNVSYVDFNTTATTSNAEGRIYWNDDIKSLEIGTENSEVQLQIGHEMVVRVNNQTGSILTKGTIVYINGAQGQRPTVTKADFSADTSSASVIGMVAADINDNSNGYVVTSGFVEGLNTIAYSAGTPLYLYTGGTYSDNKPQAPDHDVRIGKVIVSNATTGSIYVSIQNGYELDELHDVRITSATTDDVLVRSSYNGIPVWVNTKTLTGLTTVSATTISGGTFYGDGSNLTGIGGGASPVLFEVVPIQTSSVAVGTGSNDYYLNCRIPYACTISGVTFSVSSAGSDSVRIGIFRGQDTTATLVGQTAASTVSTFNTFTITEVSGQNLEFSAGEKFVVGVAIGGTTTSLYGSSCPSNNTFAWSNTTDSAAAGFPTNPRSKAGTRTSFPSIEINTF